jgi:hypothetical protein
MNHFINNHSIIQKSIMNSHQKHPFQFSFIVLSIIPYYFNFLFLLYYYEYFYLIILYWYDYYLILLNFNLPILNFFFIIFFKKFI